MGEGVGVGGGVLDLGIHIPNVLGNYTTKLHEINLWARILFLNIFL